MSKERKTTKHDARLCKAAIDLAKGYVEADINPPDTRNESTREVDHYNVNNALFKAIKEEVDVGARDIRGLFTVAKKARALELRK